MSNISAYTIASLLCLISIVLHAEMVPVHSGTGFFVNLEYVVTNEHVVGQGCSQIILQQNGTDWGLAKVYATDPALDLAILHSTKEPLTRTALRADIDTLKAGDKVAALGYPVDSARALHYSFVTAQMVNPHESVGDVRMLQFSDSTEPGFSGGPLLDMSGNVVGVVKGQVKVYQTDVTDGKAGERKLASQVDEAISLVTLEGFLQENGMSFRLANSDQGLEPAKVEAIAKDFVVNVQCLGK